MNVVSQILLHDTPDDPRWLAVPGRIPDLYVKYAAASKQAVAADPHAGAWSINTEEVGPVIFKQADFWSAIGAEKGLLPAIGNAGRGIQKFIGGPNPLTAMLLGGGLGAGLGYGAGWLGHKLAPKGVRSDAAWKFGLAGGLGGASIPGLVHGYPNVKELGIPGLWTQSRFQGRKGPMPTKPPYGPAPPSAKHIGMLSPPYKSDSNWLEQMVDGIKERLGIKVATDQFCKAAIAYGNDEFHAGADLSGVRVPTGPWGNVIMADPFLDGPSKAIAAGLPATAAVSRGSRYASVRDMQRTGMSMFGNPVQGLGGDMTRLGANLAAGWAAGKLGGIAASFMGLDIPVQRGIQRTGLLAGAVRGILGMM